MRFKLDRLRLLDECIDGRADKLAELLDNAFDHFNAFYLICKEQIGERNITTVAYNGINDNTAKFDINISDKAGSIQDVSTEDIEVISSPGRMSLNISVKG